MKRFICALMLIASVLTVFWSCNGENGKNNTTPDEQEEPPTVFGYWVLDNLTVEASSSIIGSGGANTSVIDFTRTPCHLKLAENFTATGSMGWDISISKYTLSSDGKTISFDRTISVSDDGKAMVLAGSYEIIELTYDKLVLRQPDIVVSIPGIFSAQQTAIYSYTRVPEN